jgi:hypothetical protein
MFASRRHGLGNLRMSAAWGADANNIHIKTRYGLAIIINPNCAGWLRQSAGLFLVSTTDDG